VSKYNLEALKSQGFSEEAVRDLEKSGLSLETVRRMGILPLTDESFKKYLHRSNVETPTRSSVVEDGYVIPYHHVTPAFGRVKVLKWNESSVYYQQHKENLPKYLQTSSAHVEKTVHVYFLPEAPLSSPKSVYFITEGEKKTAKLQQELDKLSTDYRKFAVLGLGGVWNWNGEVFKEAETSFQNRKVFICFDADGKFNPSVAEAEISLYSYLLSEGAVSVKSLNWNPEEGKGIDDYLTAKEREGESPEKILENLMETAVSPIEKYRETLSLDRLLYRLADYLREIPPAVAEEVKKHYKVGKREIKRKFSGLVEQRRKKLEEKLKQEADRELLNVYKKLFGIDFIPELPEGFSIKDGLLYYGSEDVCEAFVVSEIAENIDEIDGGYLATLNFMGEREIKVSSSVASSAKLFTSYLHKKKVVVSESESRKIQNYFTKFIRKNKSRIKRSYYSSRIGWNKVGDKLTYIHPLTADVALQVGSEIEEKLGKRGKREVELDAVKEWILNFPHSAVLWIFGITSSVLYPILGDDCNLVVFVQGETGTGKTTAVKGAVSFFGSPSLKKSFNFSEGGFEGFLSSLKDFPIHLEEVKQLDKNPQRRAEKFTDFVYKFVEGMGRTRMKIDLTLRSTATYRGLILTSSEMGIDEILSYSGDAYFEGIFRRVLVVNAKKETFGGERLGKLLTVFSENYGNLLADWIRYFEENRDEIERKFRERDADFSESYKLDAKVRRFLALASVVMEEVGKLYGIDTSVLWDALEEIGSFNEKLYREYILGDEESFKERLEEFIEEVAPTGLIVEQEKDGKPVLTLRESKRDFLLYSRVERENSEIVSSSLYITSTGLSELAKKFGMGRRLLTQKLKQAEFLGDREKLTVLCFGKRFYLYPLNISTRIEEEIDEIEL